MIDNMPIVCCVGCNNIGVITEMHAIIQKIGLPIVVIQEQVAPVEPIEFQIPDIKIEDIIKETEFVLSSKNKVQTKYHTNQKHYKLYNKVRDNRLKIRMQTCKNQRVKR